MDSDLSQLNLGESSGMVKGHDMESATLEREKEKSTFDRVKEKAKGLPNKLKYMIGSANKPQDHASEDQSTTEDNPRTPDHTKTLDPCFEDLPYNAADDEFTDELSLASVDGDKPVSEVNSIGSRCSWDSNEKTVSGIGAHDLGSTNDVLGPYKRVGSAQALEAVPTEYRDYFHDAHPTLNGNESPGKFPAHEENELSQGQVSRNSSQDLQQSLYADLVSISDRDIQVPAGIVKPEGFDTV